jgi:[acyl-carrier-protein] S-malonyltransferase
MGKALYDASPKAREVFARADEALGWSLSQLCFEGPEEKLTLTAHTQPAVVAVSIAALAAVKEAVADLALPAFAAGHSLGEYSALVASGALELEDAVRLVHLRGKAMQDAVPEGVGAMAALMGADSDTAKQLCADAAEGEVLQPANFNAPGQIVIGGHKAAVERAQKLAGERKLKAILLKVSAPFHCSLMSPAADAMREALASVSFKTPAFPIVSNVEARPNQDAAKLHELLVKQIAGAVLWHDSVTFMADSGVDRALEIGPGKVLAGLVKRIDKRIRVHSVGDPAAVAEVASFLAS